MLGQDLMDVHFFMALPNAMGYNSKNFLHNMASPDHNQLNSVIYFVSSYSQLWHCKNRNYSTNRILVHIVIMTGQDKTKI